MNRDTENQILILAGLWLLSKYSWEVAPALERAGAKLYDLIHDDAAHKRDLPGGQMTRQAVLDLATKVGFPNPKLASAIAFAESGGVPGAVLRTSREYSVGLWQINTMKHHHLPEDLKNPIYNAKVALDLSKRGTDWTPWSTYKNGKYRQFLTGIFA